MARTRIDPFGTVTLVGLLTLAGCGLDAAVDRMNTSTDQRACNGFGFTPGTTAYAQCMQQQAAQRSAENQQELNRMHEDEAIENLNKKH